MTLSEYITRCKELNVYPFIDMAYILEPREELTEPYIVRTVEFQQVFTEWMDMQRGRRCLSDFVDQGTFEEIRARIIAICDGIYGAEQYELEGLYATTQFDYNPIDNVAEKSYKVTFGTSKDKHYEKVGKQINRHDDASSNKDSGDVRNYDTTDYAGDTFSPVDKTESGSNGASQNIYHDTIGARNDEGGNTHSDSNAEIVDRNGNIGVTATQQLIDMERDVRKFNFYEIVAQKVARKILTLVRGI